MTDADVAYVCAAVREIVAQIPGRRMMKKGAVHSPAMISLVIPVYNEEGNLTQLMERIRPVMTSMGRPYEVVFVDDGSRDRSLEILEGFAQSSEVRVVELTRNYGQHAAILAGFSIVRGEIVVTLDADLQNPPEEIPRLIATMEEGGFDVVGTIRRGRKDSFFRIIPSKIVNMVARKITGVRMTDWGCMLRAYRRAVVERMSACHEHATFIPALATHFGKRVTEIEVAHEERHGGKSNYPLRKLINLQFDLVASFSDLPIKLIMYGGVAMAALGVCFRHRPCRGTSRLRRALGGAGGFHPLCDPLRLCGIAVFRPRRSSASISGGSTARSGNGRNT